jgi:hypothetical protein
MKKCHIIPFIILIFCTAIPLYANDPERNIILIGWDGAQRNHVKEMLDRNELPVLASLGKEGAMVDIDITNGATDTKAGWTQILTGYRCETTGVYNNARYRPIPVGYSVFERLENFFGSDNIDTVAVIGKKAHVDNDPPVKMKYSVWIAREKKQRRINKNAIGLGNIPGGRIVEENGVKYVLVPGKPWFNASKRMDLFVNGLLEDSVVTKRTLEELEKRKDHRFFFFIHFAYPDHDGHIYGENSQQYSDGIKNDDASTGIILAKLKELGLYDKTLVYVTADHGFNEGEKGHSYAPFVFLATNDKAVNRDGDRMDIAPTILKRFGLDLKTIEPKLDGTPLDESAQRKIAPEQKPAPPRKAEGKQKPMKKNSD